MVTSRRVSRVLVNRDVPKNAIGEVHAHVALTRRYMTRTAHPASIKWSILRTPEWTWTLTAPKR